MDDVTGFNQKNQVNDGENLVEKGIQELKVRYSDHVLEIVRLMLKFEEKERPSFIELGKLVLTSTDNSPVVSPKGDKKMNVSGPRKSFQSQEATKRSGVAKTFSMQKLKDTANQEEIKSIQGADEPQIMSGKKIGGSEKL